MIFDEQPDFMTELHLRTTTDAAAAAFANLDLTARAAKRGGDDRNLDQLRADIAIGWLTEGAHGTLVRRPAGVCGGHLVGNGDVATMCLPRPSAALLNVTVAATTLLEVDEEPATLHGPAGPVMVPAPLARELAHSPRTERWRRLLYDKTSGVLTDVKSGYHPPPRMTAFVRARDGHRSRLPISCATHLELDHLRPYDHGRPADGGQTTPSNLVSDGLRDHHLKSDRALTMTGDANDVLTITTPSGRSYPSHPYLYADPHPEPEPRCRSSGEGA